MFNYKFIKESEMENCPWLFKGICELDISLDECWKIITDDEASKIWHPEVSNYNYTKPFGLGGRRTILFSHWIFNLLVGGANITREEFDVFEDKGSDMRRFQFWISGTSRPQFLTYESIREEFKVEALGDNKCRFTRTVGMVPAFGTRFLLGCIVYRTNRSIFAEDCPKRLAGAVKDSVLPFKTVS